MIEVGPLRPDDQGRTTCSTGETRDHARAAAALTPSMNSPMPNR